MRMMYADTMSRENPSPELPARKVRATRRSRTPVSYEDLGRIEPRRSDGVKRRGRPNEPLLLVAVLLLLAIGGSAFAISLHRSSANRSTPVSAAAYGVVFVIDGAGPDDLELAAMPNLGGLQSEGTTFTNAWLGQLEASTPASSATLGTGVQPREHGLVGNRWRIGSGEQVGSALEARQVRQGSLDQLMELHGATPLAGVLKEHDGAARVLSVGGAGCAAASASGTWLADYVLCPRRDRGRWVVSSVTGHEPPAGSIPDPSLRVPAATGKSLGPQVEGWVLGQQDDWVARCAVWAIRQMRPHLIYVTFPEVGLVERWASAARRGQIVGQLMAGIDRDIGRVRQEMRRLRVEASTVYVVTSGQAVVPVRRRLRGTALDEAILAAGGQKVYVDGDSSAMVGLHDTLQAQPVAQALQAEHERNVDAIYFRAAITGGYSYVRQYFNPSLSPDYSRALIYLVGTLASSLSPDVVEIYAPRTVAGDARLGTFHLTGAGSSPQWPNQHIPLIVSGHGALSGWSAYPARLVDVVPTLEALMGLSASRSDGSVLADALVDPPAGTIDRQRRSERWLVPLVRALQRRVASDAG